MQLKLANLVPIINLLKSRLVQLGLIALVGVGGGAYLHSKLSPPTITTTIVHDIKQVRVDVPVLTEKIVDRIITDPREQAAIAKLIKENHELKFKLTQVSSTVATNTTTGSGTPSEVVRGTAAEGNPVQGLPPVSNQVYRFNDYQLTATYGPKTFDYKLVQTFIIESTTGKNSKGGSIGIVRLFQDTPKGLVPIPAQTTVIQANENTPRWFVSPRGQVGLGINLDKSRMGLAAFQWLKKGTSRAPEDIRWAVLSPAVSISNAQAVPSVLPFSYNLGSLKYAPVTNIWLSPIVSRTMKVGFVVTTTF